MANDDFAARAVDYKTRVEHFLTDFVTARHPTRERLGQALTYAVNSRGKRIRPLLAYAAAEMLALPAAVADYPAAAVEMMHTASLVHDDLPAMDNDDLRRGQPALHKQFDEATAILVGDTLQILAFELLAEADVAPTVVLAWSRHLAASVAGSQGMIQGQMMDIEATGRTLTPAELQAMHRYKSGALIAASMTLIAMAQDTAKHSAIRQFSLFGHHLGLAFQIRDDILDVEATTAQLGKPRNSDAINQKSTYTSQFGLDGARELMAASLAEAEAILGEWGDSANSLKWLTQYIAERRY